MNGISAAPRCGAGQGAHTNRQGRRDHQGRYVPGLVNNVVADHTEFSSSHLNAERLLHDGFLALPGCQRCLAGHIDRTGHLDRAGQA
jgi:hypothetical protein